MLKRRQLLDKPMQRVTLPKLSLSLKTVKKAVKVIETNSASNTDTLPMEPDTMDVTPLLPKTNKKMKVWQV